MTKTRFNFNWHTIYRNIRANLGLGILWVMLILSLVIAFPRIEFERNGESYQFDGLDFTDIARAGDKNIPREFQFRPTLDFYGGTEYVYTPAGTDGVKVSRGTALSLVEDLHQRFSNVGISDYEIYLREGANTTEIVAKLPYREEELTNFHSYLTLDGDFEFVVSVPQGEGEEASLTPQTRTLDIKRSDIQSINLNYGSETSGNGFVIRFKDDSFAKALVNMWSDVNTDANARVLMQIDGQPVAGQTAPVYSNDPGRNLYMTTGLVDDRLAARLLKDILVNDTLGTAVEVRTASTAPGRYDRYLNGVRWGMVVVIASLMALLIVTKRAAGLALAITLLFIASASVALFKIMALPIALASLMGYVLALLLWFISINHIVPVFSIRKRPVLTREELVVGIETNRRLYRNFLIISTGFLILVEMLSIPAIHLLAVYFASTSFVVWVSYLYVLPTSLNLLRFNRTNEN